ncbi:TRAP transporter small permease [Marinomonas sp. 15G1-11]|uniref:TRAP transporter small permease protein n=1 Tax=Marinomonas phaeophyticola TaxID=3004091 RepID=A0ABT4JXG5_9GAMM|nr:TRAP transporter small permease [Marinomonas sp. 15G1-11]MCZ2722906.1 TRAP transporter small permease [Marinomonas sp. 15G1-11]
MNLLRKLDENFEPALIIASVSLIVVLIFTNVILRLFDTTLPWAGELSRYLFVWMVYLGISYGIKKKRHLKVSVLFDILPRKASLVAQIFSDLLFLAYSFVVLYYGYVITAKAISRNQIAPAMEVSVGLLYAALVIGSLLSIIRLLMSINEHCGNWNTSEEAQ